MSEEAEFLGLSVPDDRIVDHQLTEKEILFCDQAELLVYTGMKTLMPTSADGKEEHVYLVPPRNNIFPHKIAHLPYMQFVMKLKTWIMYLVYMLIVRTQIFVTRYLIHL